MRTFVALANLACAGLGVTLHNYGLAVINFGLFLWTIQEFTQS